MRAISTAVVVTALLLAACGEDVPQPDPAGTRAATLSVSSASFEAGGEIPAEFGCDAGGAFPGLTWDGVPEATQSLAVTVLDPDAPGGTFVHALVADLPPGTAGLADVTQVPRGATLGSNSAGDTAYVPPCPPEGDDPHRYVFTVYAVDTTLDLESGFDLEDLADALDGHVVGSGDITATFAR